MKDFNASKKSSKMSRFIVLCSKKTYVSINTKFISIFSGSFAHLPILKCKQVTSLTWDSEICHIQQSMFILEWKTINPTYDAGPASKYEGKITVLSTVLVNIHGCLNSIFVYNFYLMVVESFVYISHLWLWLVYTKGHDSCFQISVLILLYRRCYAWLRKRHITSK